MKLPRPVIKKLRAFLLYLIRYFRLQLFLTLCSFPILVSWGIPLSYASVIGNLIFTPFITIFLLISSLIFLTELMYIPNTVFIQLLEWVTTGWLFLLECGKRSWLFGCAAPHPLVLAAIPLIACFIVLHKKLSSPLLNTFALFCLLITCCLTSKFLAFMKESISKIHYLDKELLLFQSGTHAILIDPAALGRRISAPSWIQFTLVPHLTKQGITVLSVICTRPSSMTFQALVSLIEKFEIDAIYLPCWSGSLTNKGWCAWEKLATLSKKNDTKIRAVTRSCTITEGKYTLTLIPEDSVTKKNKFTYNALRIKY